MKEKLEEKKETPAEEKKEEKAEGSKTPENPPATDKSEDVIAPPQKTAAHSDPYGYKPYDARAKKKPVSLSNLSGLSKR